MGQQMTPEKRPKPSKTNELYPPPKPGDLIEIFRDHYQHWAVYVGDGKVVHLGDVDSGFSGINLKGSAFGWNTRAVVRKDLLSDVTHGDSYCINNKYEEKLQQRCAKDIVQRAEELVGKELPYSVTNHNCEHFVTNLCFGIPLSDQVEENPLVLLRLRKAAANEPSFTCKANFFLTIDKAE